MRAAVVGVGHLGRHHARILASLPGITLAGVVDTNRERAGQVAGEHGAQGCGDFREIAGKLDIAVVSAPTESHAVLTMPLIASGVHVLVEKPVTQTLAEADLLIAAAKAAGVVLA